MIDKNYWAGYNMNHNNYQKVVDNNSNHNNFLQADNNQNNKSFLLAYLVLKDQ